MANSPKITEDKRQQREREAIRSFYQAHPGWALLQVAHCLECDKSNICHGHRYAYRKWWVNTSGGLKQ